MWNPRFKHSNQSADKHSTSAAGPAPAWPQVIAAGETCHRSRTGRTSFTAQTRIMYTSDSECVVKTIENQMLNGIPYGNNTHNTLPCLPCAPNSQLPILNPSDGQCCQRDSSRWHRVRLMLEHLQSCHRETATIRLEFHLKVFSHSQSSPYLKDSQSWKMLTAELEPPTNNQQPTNIN